MNTLVTEIRISKITSVNINNERLTVELQDGRAISVPLVWYPRLLVGAPNERTHWRIIGDGEGIHWPALDEDISIENLLSGTPSKEKQETLQKWIAEKKADYLINPYYSDLLQIQGISTEYLDLLNELFINSIDDLIKYEPTSLENKIIEVNKKLDLVRKLPSLEKIADWINQAEGLARKNPTKTK